jgi:uncharacterized membrane protein
MTTTSHLWAIGYDDVERAKQVRDEIVKLGWDDQYFYLEDVVVVVRHPDGSFAFDHARFPGALNVLACTTVGFLAGLVVAAPLGGAAVGALLGGAGTAAMAASAGIGNDFILEVEKLMKPGTSALFVLDAEGDMAVILHGIRGLGGTVMKTNVDVERAKLIQSTLCADSTDPSDQAPKTSGTSE